MVHSLRKVALTGLSLLYLLAFVGCTGCSPTFNSDAKNQASKIFVWHEPIHPAPGQDITIKALSETGQAVPSTIKITFQREGDPSPEIKICNNTNECTLNVVNLSSSPKFATYSAYIENNAGEKTYSMASYYFDIGNPPGKNLITLRAPVSIKGHAFKISFVRDIPSYHDNHLLFYEDAEKFLYQQILKDPAYRWRDNQLGFYYSLTGGKTTDVNSGLSTRCGNDPWPGEFTPDFLSTSDVIGVIHRHSNFRDCSGVGNTETGPIFFSGKGDAPLVVQHELGHALFSLGDEYNDPATSEHPGGPANPNELSVCVCCTPCTPTLPTDSGSNQGPVLQVPDLPVEGETPCSYDCKLGQPSCIGFAPPKVCSEVLPFCSGPGGCNTFLTEQECLASVSKLNNHPGVTQPVVAGDCRALCGTADTGPCSCSISEVWIIDKQNPSSGNNMSDLIDGDIMKTTSDILFKRNGAACESCMEKGLCLAWERSRGESEANANAKCVTPYN
ncbi:MAG: hypothetical protein ABUK01_14770 [Leptospirales bacterium]